MFGSSLQGYITVSYQELVNTFGEPNAQTDGYKTDAEWEMNVTRDGRQTVNIYNWKDGPNYMGNEGTPVGEITRWHIGGQSKLAVQYVYGMLAKGLPPTDAYM